MATKASQPSLVWIKVAALSVSTTLFTLGIGSASVAMPTLAKAFELSYAQVQWVVLAYLLATTSLMVSVGRLGDLYGRRKVLLFGLTLFAVASAICGLSSSYWIIVGARAVQGLGGAAMLVLSLALVSESVSPEKSGTAIGILGAMSAVGTALGPSLGGVLIALAGWRGVFLFNLPFVLTTIFLIARFMPSTGQERKERTNEKFDLRGTLLIAASLTAYALAMTGEGRPLEWNVAIFTGAAIGVGVFAYSQSRVKSPLVQLAAFRSAALGGALFGFFVVAMVATMTLVVTPFYLTRSLLLGEAIVGGILSIAPITSALTGPFMGRLADRFGARQMVMFGMVQISCGFVLIAILTRFAPIAGFIAGYVMFGIGYVLFIVANTTSVMSGAAQERRGVTAGTLQLFRYMGSISGAAVLGAVFSAASGFEEGAVAPPDSITFGMQMTYAVSAVIVLAGAAVYRFATTSQMRSGGTR